MTTTAVRVRRRLALAAILLALLAVAAAWLLRPRQDAFHTKIIEGPVGLQSQVNSAIDEARNRDRKELLLGVQFTAQGGAVTPCPKGATEAANAIKRAPLRVTVLVEADQLGVACAQAFGAQFEHCVGAGALKSCISRPGRSGSFWKTLLALVVCALLAAVAWGLLRRPRQPIPPPSPPEGPERTQPPSWPEEPTPEWRRAVHPLAGHPLAERLRYPQPAEVRSVLDPAGFVAFEGGLWRAAWGEHPPPPGVGTWVLIQFDEPTAQLVARSGR